MNSLESRIQNCYKVPIAEPAATVFFDGPGSDEQPLAGQFRGLEYRDGLLVLDPDASMAPRGPGLAIRPIAIACVALRLLLSSSQKVAKVLQTERSTVTYNIRSARLRVGCPRVEYGYNDQQEIRRTAFRALGHLVAGGILAIAHQSTLLALTDQECAVVQEIAGGKTLYEVADTLYYSCKVISDRIEQATRNNGIVVGGQIATGNLVLAATMSGQIQLPRMTNG